MSSDPYEDAHRHSNRYECRACSWSVWVDWWDGGGAVSQTPIVECGNDNCDNSRMTVVD